ncbi:acetyl-CoA C-acyltransferase [Geobacillus subterraneus]|uniref:acetyl-CoA C-acyltransferase n=1 Tax=Geobacillus subterraneus TaxID=129338 RepID=UPI001442C968|nr:acetyl-CoA C-acyltransferase [Geobacillus subterraneus]QIZ67560.1 acetyl-CoA C-acyltransferase [Geobacillus subterraneus]
MNYEFLQCEIENRVAVVSIHRPPLNPLNTKVFQELSALIDELEANQQVGAIVITGTGEKAFVAGADIHEMMDLDLAGMMEMNKISRSAFSKIENASQPVIAAVNGLALGGGCELALACDLRICSDNAKFAFPEVNLGIIPGGGGTQRLPRIVGQGVAKELLYFGEMIDAQRALAAIEKGYFRQEIAPVTVQARKGETVIDTDEHPRRTSLEQLRSLQPRFLENGVVTPGNASGMNDGAAAVIVASAEYAAKRGLKPLARLVSWGVVGVEPQYMGIGPVPAIRQALEKANLSIDDLDLIEINEAFSAQYLACQKELGFEDDKGNVNGGAVALGHPLAASGTRITLTLLYELERRGKKYGASSLCIGGGQGIAAIWERL